MKHFILMLIFFTSLCSSIKSQWINTGCPYDYMTHSIAIDGNRIFVASNSHYIYASTNYGLSWFQSSSGLGDQFIYAVEIVNNYVFAGTEFSGIYRSSNNGASWIAINNGLTTYSIYCIKTNGSTIYAGCQGGGLVYKTTNLGTNWILCNYGIAGLMVSDFAFKGNSIFATTEGPGHGVYLSTNAGSNWYNISGAIGNNDCYSVYTIDNYVFVGASVQASSCIFVSTNSGANWNLVGTFSGFDVEPYDIRCFRNSIYVANATAGVYKADLGTYNWIEYNEGMPQFGHFVISLANDSLNIFAGLVNQNGGNGVWKRTLSTSIPSTPVLFSPPNNISNISLNPNLIWFKSLYALTYRVQLSTDSSFNNLIVNDSTLTDTIKSISGLNYLTTYWWRVNAKNPNGTSNYSSIWKFATIPTIPNPPQLHSPSNNSQGWGLNLNLVWHKSLGASTYRAQLSVDSLFGNILVDDSTLTDTVKSVNGLANNTTYYWRVNAKNASGTSAWSFTWKFRTGYVGIINFNHSSPKTFKLSQNNPNPFNPTTKIKFDIPKTTFVRMTVYDLLGKEVTKLVNEELKPGSYSVNWDGSNFPSGVYLLYMKAGDFAKTVKMILTK